VPNFGRDPEITYTLKNADAAAKRYKINWNPDEPWKTPKSHPVDYKVPDFGLDKDIVDSLSNLKNTEEKLGTWTLPKEDVQLDADVSLEREPLLSWKPKRAKSAHPIDYFVPNFGVDHDILATQRHIKKTEKRLKKKWNPKKDEDGNWILPKEDAFFKL